MEGYNFENNSHTRRPTNPQLRDYPTRYGGTRFDRVIASVPVRLAVNWARYFFALMFFVIVGGVLDGGLSHGVFNNLMTLAGVVSGALAFGGALLLARHYGRHNKGQLKVSLLPGIEQPPVHTNDDLLVIKVENALQGTPIGRIAMNTCYLTGIGYFVGSYYNNPLVTLGFQPQVAWTIGAAFTAAVLNEPLQVVVNKLRDVVVNRWQAGMHDSSNFRRTVKKTAPHIYNFIRHSLAPSMKGTAAHLFAAYYTGYIISALNENPPDRQLHDANTYMWAFGMTDFLMRLAETRLGVPVNSEQSDETQGLLNEENNSAKPTNCCFKLFDRCRGKSSLEDGSNRSSTILDISPNNFSDT